MGAFPPEPGRGNCGGCGRDSSNVANDDNACGHYRKEEGPRVLLRPLLVRDIRHRTPDGGWLVESVLNSLPGGVGNLVTTTMMTTGGERGRGDGTRSTADGNNCKYNDKHGNGNNDNCGGPLLLFVWEQDLLSLTLAKMNVGIVRPRMLS